MGENNGGVRAKRFSVHFIIYVLARRLLLGPLVDLLQQELEDVSGHVLLDLAHFLADQVVALLFVIVKDTPQVQLIVDRLDLLNLGGLVLRKVRVIWLALAT